MASILLNSEARDVNDHVNRGLLKESEGEHHLERIEKELDSVHKAEYCEVNRLRVLFAGGKTAELTPRTERTNRRSLFENNDEDDDEDGFNGVAMEMEVGASNSKVEVGYAPIVV